MTPSAEHDHHTPSPSVTPQPAKTSAFEGCAHVITVLLALTAAVSLVGAVGEVVLIIQDFRQVSGDLQMERVGNFIGFWFPFLACAFSAAALKALTKLVVQR